MALYDLSDKFQLAQAETYFKKLVDSACVVELKKKMHRTLQQNKYLHLLLSWFAVETGYSLEYVKTEFFKRTCNPQIFVVRVKGRMGSVEDLRSSADLSTKEMTTAIDRFRNWSASEVGIYLPEANENEFLQQIEVEISKKQQWI